MFKWMIILSVISIVSVVLGYGGSSDPAADIAQKVFLLSMLLLVITSIIERVRRFD